MIYCKANHGADEMEEAEVVNIDARVGVGLVRAAVRQMEQRILRIDHFSDEHGEPLALDSRPLSQTYDEKLVIVISDGPLLAHLQTGC